MIRARLGTTETRFEVSCMGRPTCITEMMRSFLARPASRRPSSSAAQASHATGAEAISMTAEVHLNPRWAAIIQRYSETSSEAVAIAISRYRCCLCLALDMVAAMKPNRLPDCLCRKVLTDMSVKRSSFARGSWGQANDQKVFAWGPHKSRHTGGCTGQANSSTAAELQASSLCLFADEHYQLLCSTLLGAPPLWWRVIVDIQGTPLEPEIRLVATHHRPLRLINFV
jgi:hypothetical protein